MALAQLLLAIAHVVVAVPTLTPPLNESTSSQLRPAAARPLVCPRVATQGDFNLEEWIRASWYIQQQQVTGYQSPEDLFCVVAT